MDVTSFLADWSAGDSRSGPRIRQARVRSVDSDPTYTITTGQAVIVPSSAEWGQSEIVANYLGEYPPRPGGSCWYVTDGVDRIILGMMAPDGPPSASITLAAATAVASSATTVITTGSVLHDPWNMAESSGTALQIPADGVYSLMAYASWGANANGFRQVNLFRNGTTITVNRMASSPTSNPSHATLHPGFPMSKGDLVSTSVQQTTSGSINLNLLTLSAQYVGRRRTAGTASDVMTDGNFASSSLNVSDVSKWFTYTQGASSVALDQSPNTYLTNVNAVKFTATSGNINGLFSTEGIAVVPGQKWQMKWAVKGSVAMTEGVNFSNYMAVYGAASGPVDENLSWGTFILPTVTSPSVTTSYSIQTGTFTIPPGVFVIRLDYEFVQSTGSTRSLWFGNVTLQEIIS